MAELLPTERIRPCLLDRLTDYAPHRRKEARNKRVITIRQYREYVLRDLGWLLNTANREQLDDYDDFEEIQHSVLNFGIPDLCGLPVSGINLKDLSARIRLAIQWCEPRIIPSTLEVAPVSGDAATANVLSFEIQGELWAEPFNEMLLIKTSVDLENGEFKLKEGV
jgi:type VI secretion system protein ImpF